MVTNITDVLIQARMALGGCAGARAARCAGGAACAVAEFSGRDGPASARGYV